MKVLVRSFGDKVYEWLDAKYDKGYFYIDGYELNEADIVSVLDDNRAEYVVCSSCGALIKNEAAAIEAHKNKYKDCSACFDCKYLREDVKKLVDVKYDLQPSGEYVANKNIVVNLQCGASYWSHPIIHTEDARETCAYRGCVNATTQSVTDIFIEKPGVFDDIITVDKIVEAGYKTALNYHRGSVGYRLKGRNEIYAVVNSMNVVDNFQIDYRGSSYIIYYSKKYNEFYYVGRRGKYVIWNNFTGMPTATTEYIKNKIAKLYQ